eukprot:364192-Rhodomonas_salina.2
MGIAIWFEDTDEGRICLRGCYAMSGTDLAEGCIVLQSCCAMSGTDLGSAKSGTNQYRIYRTVLRGCYRYAAVRHARAMQYPAVPAPY